MQPTPTSQAKVRFGVFEADLAAGELRKGGRRVRLQEQPFQVLAALLARPGELVTREELQQALWPSDTFVEFDHGINTAIKKIRQALGDSPQNPRFVETVPRRGYRFIAPVNGSSAASPAPRRSRAWIAILAAVFVGSLITWLVARNRERPGHELTATPITTFPGWERQPSFSPDGTQVAFTWDGESEDNYDIYVKVIGTENPLRLTNNPAVEVSPAWSPDGRYIAFVRAESAQKAGVYLIPPLGGPEARLVETNYSPFKPSYGSHLAWSPDGQALAIIDRAAPNAPLSVYLVSLDDRKKRALTNPPRGILGDDFPAFSPDGRALAFSRFENSEISNLYILELSQRLTPEGKPRRLTSEKTLAAAPTWTADGRSLVFVHGWKHLPSLARLGVSEAKNPVILLSLGQGNTAPAISHRLGRLAFSQGCGDVNIWRLGLMENKPPAKHIASTRLDHLPRFSPDGRRIAFISGRTGTPQVWVSDTDGRNLRQLTALGQSDWPAWSPDAQRIAFCSRSAGRSDIFVVDASGGAPARLTAGMDNASAPSWSRDGQWIYFSSTRTGERQVWKIPGGGGGAVQITRAGGRAPQESPDGKLLYYLKSDDSLWRMPAAGGQEKQVLDSVLADNFVPVEDGIYFIAESGRGGAIQFLNFADGTIQTIQTIDNLVMWGFTVSPDRHSLLYTTLDQVIGDLMLVENFR